MHVADLLSHRTLLTPEQGVLIVSPVFYATAWG